MPLDPQLSRAYPLLLENDALSLSHSFSLRDNQLCDVVIRASHILHKPGDILVSLLSDVTTFNALHQSAIKLGVQSAQFSEFLGFLNKIGALRCQRSVKSRFRAKAIQVRDLFYGIRYSPICSRQPATLRSIATGSFRATLPVTVVSGLAGTLAWASGLMVPHAVIQLVCFGLAVFLVSIIVHESAHMLVLKKANITADVLQIGLHLGILHTIPRKPIEIALSLMGPLTGGFFSASAAVLALLLHAPLLAMTSSGVALLHGASLLPFYGDGASLYKALRKRKHKL